MTTSAVSVNPPYTLLNDDNGECVTQIWNGYTQWPGFNLQGCTGNDWQQIRYNSDQTISSGVGGYMVFDSHGNVGSTQDAGKARESGYQYNIFSAVPTSNLTGDAAIQYGPVKIQGKWSSGDLAGILDRDSSNNNTRLNWSSGGRSQSWIAKALADVCYNLGITDFTQCNQDSICQTALQNGVDMASCRNWAKNKPPSSDIDALVSTYCSKNPSDHDFCGCYNTDDSFKQLQTAAGSQGLALTPWCNASTCASNANAYIATTKKGINCPPQQFCLQSVDIGSANTSSITGVTFSCAQKSTTNDTTNDTSTTTNNTNNTTNNTTSSPASTSLTHAAALTTGEESKTLKQQFEDYKASNPVMVGIAGSIIGLLILLVLISIMKRK